MYLNLSKLLNLEKALRTLIFERVKDMTSKDAEWSLSEAVGCFDETCETLIPEEFHVKHVVETLLFVRKFISENKTKISEETHKLNSPKKEEQEKEEETILEMISNNEFNANNNDNSEPERKDAPIYSPPTYLTTNESRNFCNDLGESRIKELFLQSTSKEFQSKYEIVEFKMINNPILEDIFFNYVASLKSKSNLSEFMKQTWKEYNEVPHRNKIMIRLEEQIRKFSQTYPNSQPSLPIKLLPLWHGTNKQNIENILKNNLEALQTIDYGLFGKGIYLTNSAEHAASVYGKSLLLCWTSFLNPYPVIKEDLFKLEGKTAITPHDIHYVPVVPQSNNPQEKVFIPAEKDETPIYDEYVFFQKNQILPLCYIELKEKTNDATPTFSEPIKQTDPKEWNIEEVGKWLNNARLGEYVDTFKNENIDGEALLELTEEDLKEMGFSIGGKKTFLRNIKNLKK